jgi:hypothetical protein
VFHLFFIICSFASLLSLGKKQGFNEKPKFRSQRKKLFSSNLDVSSEIAPVEVSKR